MVNILFSILLKKNFKDEINILHKEKLTRYQILHSLLKKWITFIRTINSYFDLKILNRFKILVFLCSLWLVFLGNLRKTCVDVLKYQGNQTLLHTWNLFEIYLL